MSKQPIARVCVFCGSNTGRDERHTRAAEQLGRLLAQRHITVVYGGGRVGLMGVVADAALEAGGDVIGVIPRALDTRELAHDGLTEMHVVETMHQRKALMADLSDGFVALPGGLGTGDEFFEIVTWAQLGIHHKPCALLNVAGFFDPLIEYLDHCVDQGFVWPEHRRLVLVARHPADVLEQMYAYQPPNVERWIKRAEV